MYINFSFFRILYLLDFRIVLFETFLCHSRQTECYFFCVGVKYGCDSERRTLLQVSENKLLASKKDDIM
jgi:ABC-type multidrug transport system permease subunit